MKPVTPYPEIITLSESLWLMTTYTRINPYELLIKNYLVSTEWSIARQVRLTWDESIALKEILRRGKQNVH